MKTCLVFCLVVIATVSAQQSLGSYNVDTSKISVSGISAGAMMATQMHVAYASSIMGTGLVAGAPYYCAKGSTVTALGACMDKPENIDVNELIQQANAYAATGKNDPTSAMRNSKVYIFAGTEDTTVYQGVGMKAQQFYLSYVDEANIKPVFDIAAAHTFPTLDYGNECNRAARPYISKCDYYAAYIMLQHFYGDLQEPSSSVSLTGQFYEFDQTEFISGSGSSLDTIGYIYVPSACVSGATQCRLHVVYHGCLQGRHRLDDEFARNCGYNEVGEVNNIIMLYPQCTSSFVPNNPNGCFDWWGYAGDD